MRKSARVLALISILVFCAESSRAQSAHYDPHCLDKAPDQTSLDICASAEAKHADAEMNRVYRQLCAKLSSNPNAKTKVIASQKAWLAYRDSYIQATYPEEDKQLHYGTRYPMDVDLLIAYLTHAQTKALRDLIEAYEDPR